MKKSKALGEDSIPIELHLTCVLRNRECQTAGTMQTMRILIEKRNEHKISIVIAFVDYEKAFNSMDALYDCRTDSRYSEFIYYFDLCL